MDLPRIMLVLSEWICIDQYSQKQKHKKKRKTLLLIKKKGHYYKDGISKMISTTLWMECY